MRSKSFFQLIIETAIWAAVIVGLFYVGGIAMVLSSSSSGSSNENSSKNNIVGETQWLIHLDKSMKSVDVIVHSLKIIEDDPDLEGRVLRLTVSDKVGADKPTPYNLISGLHILIGTGWQVSGKELQSFDWVQILVRSEDAESYDVLIQFSDLLALVEGKLTEEAYFQTWQIFGEVPDFLVPGQ